MQICLEPKTVTSNIDSKPLEFKIDNNPIIFSIFRDKMYEYPIKSCVREICDNARDAHREVGTPHIPIEITLPGDYIVIKDYGPGISPERIEEIYCYYGRSTKRDNNLQGGGYGLGSKLPFAYTDSFTVTTIVNGLKYEYLMYIDESQRGAIKLINQTETEESNGTEIRIPVASYDKHQWIEAVEQTTKFYHVSGDAHPKIRGQIKQPDYPQIKTRGEGWVRFNTNHELIIIVNGIPYNVNRYDFNIDYDMSVSLIFDVGELDLASNREYIQVNNKNKQKILERIAEYRKYVSNMIENSLDDIEDFATVLKTLNDYRNSLNQKEYEWKGLKFNYPLEFSTARFDTYKRKFIYSNRLLSSDNIIIVDVDADMVNILRKCVKYANQQGWKDFHIIEKKWPINGIPYSSIKLERKYSGQYTSRPKGKIKSHSVDEYLDLDRTDREDIIYLSASEYNTQKPFGFLCKFHVIADGNAKRVKELDGWIHYSDVEKELLDSIDKDKLQQYLNDKCNIPEYPLSSFPKHILKKLGYSLEIIPPEEIANLDVNIVANKLNMNGKKTAIEPGSIFPLWEYIKYNCSDKNVLDYMDSILKEKFND